jgi:hypothetical protein
MRRLPTLGVLALAVVAAGCDEGRTSVLEPFGEIAIGAAVGPAALNLPGGSVTVAANVATIKLLNLRVPNGPTYHFWYVSRDANGVDVYTPAFGAILEFFHRDSLSGGTTGTPVPDPVTGNIITVKDTNEVSLIRTGAYAGTDLFAVDTIQVVMDSAADVGTTTPALGRNAVVVSLGTGAPTDAMFLFRRTAVAGNGALSFGNFGGTDAVSATNPADYVFAPGGTGNILFRGGEAVADIRELRRPPVGFFYRGFLVDTAGTAVLIDTLRSAYDAIASQSRVSLFDADVNPQLPGIAVTAITRSQVRNCTSGSGITTCANLTPMTLPGPATAPFAGQAVFILTLDPKGTSAELGETVILLANIPDRVWGN